ncbi:MAG: FkbM family methyltransferase [Spirochaeta sp.]|nr:FkbM family methyltransferase [Spirochaeta sp.]
MNDIGGYTDIHDNLRYWLARLTAEVSASTAGERPIVFLDVGSNDGELSIPVARDVAGRNGRPLQVVACEPLPSARARLIERASESGLSVAMWGVADVTVVPLALGDRDEMIELAVYSDDTFSSLYERSPDEQERYSLEVTGTVSVRMRPLADLVAAGTVPPPDIVKIDVEGAERAVLAGAARVLAEYRPPVVMEFSCINTANAGYDRQVLIRQLREMGYDRIYGLYRNTDRTLYGPPTFDDCRIWNVIAVPPGEQWIRNSDISEAGPFP